MKQQEEDTGVFWRLVKEALVESIHAHGPIVRENLGSAIKRVVRILVMSKDMRLEFGDLTDKIRIDTLEFYYRAEIGSLKKVNKKLIEENRRLTAELSTLPAKQQWIDKLRETVEIVNNERIEYREALKEAGFVVFKNFRRKLVEKIAWNLWNANGRREGHADEDWHAAEKIADALLRWKPDSKNKVFAYLEK